MEMFRPRSDPAALGAGRPVMVVASPTSAGEAVAALRGAGVRGHVEVVHDGLEALDHLYPQVTSDPPRDELPSFIVVDLDLPAGHARRLLRKVRGSGRTRVLPLIVLATSVRSRGLSESLDEGASIGLLKPLTALSLKQALRSIGLGRLLFESDTSAVVDGRLVLAGASSLVQ